MRLRERQERAGARRRLARVAMALAAGLAVVACGDDSPTTPENHELHSVTQLTVTPLDAELAVGDRITLTATAKCDHGIVMHPTMTWSTDDAAVATVEDGEVTAVGFGDTHIVVAAASLAAYAEISVAPEGTVVDATGGTVTFEGLTLEIPAGALTEPTDIVVTALDDALFEADPLYIAGTAFAIAPDGLVLNGGATLRIVYDPANVSGDMLQERLRIRERDEEQQQWREMVQSRVRLQEHDVASDIQHLGRYGIGARDAAALPVAAVSVTPAILALRPGDTGQLTAAVVDDEGLPLDRPVAWSSSDEAVATVSAGGEVIGVTEGEATIRAEVGGKSALAQVTVTAEVGSVTVTPAASTVTAGETVQLAAEARDADGTVLVRTFAWSSSNEVVATVDDAGLVTTLAAGTVTITAAADGVNGSAVITVNPLIVSVQLSESVLDVFEGDIIQLEAVALDADGKPVATAFVWESSDETIATVSATGLVTAVGSGSVTITAAAGGKKGSSNVSVGRIQAVTVTPATAWVAIGSTIQLTAEAFDAQGNPVERSFTWTSSGTSIAEVSSSGVVTGIGAGTATITAQTGGASGAATVTVTAPAARVEIADPGMRPLEIGLTLQLVATVFDAQNNPVTDAVIIWSSSMPNIASVDQNGLVTGLLPSPQQKVIITATAGSASDQVEIRVVGEAEAEGGNNLSYPVIFADGIGVTGLAVSTDPGVRPTVESGIVVDELPFFWEGNVPDYEETWYLQQGVNTWRAEYVDGTGQPAYDAQIFWGDNLQQTWTATRPIRIEQSLYEPSLLMTGYYMEVMYGSGMTEMQATNGTTVDVMPSIYVTGATLTIAKIDSEGAKSEQVLLELDPTTEVNVAGKIIWGYLLRLDELGETEGGWYRLTFTLPQSANARITTVGNVGESGELTHPIYVSKDGLSSWMDILVEP